MPINVTVTNLGKILLQETIIKILVFILAASGLNSKIYIFFPLRLSRIIFAGRTKHSKSYGFNMGSSGLCESIKNVFFNYVRRYL